MTICFENKKQFDDFVNQDRNYGSPHGNVICNLYEPEQYPCVLTYDIHVDDNGPDYVDGEYVYLSDFNCEAIDKVINELKNSTINVSNQEIDKFGENYVINHLTQNEIDTTDLIDILNKAEKWFINEVQELYIGKPSVDSILEFRQFIKHYLS